MTGLKASLQAGVAFGQACFDPLALKNIIRGLVYLGGLDSCSSHGSLISWFLCSRVFLPLPLVFNYLLILLILFRSLPSGLL